MQIKSSVGQLELINARTSHPLVEELKNKGYDLNEGFAVKFNNQYYHGADAVHFLALVGSSNTLFNQMNVFLFRSKLLAAAFYPLLKVFRNLLLFIRKIPKIPLNHNPIFANIFAEKWHELPTVMKAHYANHPYSHDVVKVSGKMTITTFGFGKMLFPLFSILGIWVPYTGKDIVVEVYFRSNPLTNDFHFERVYHVPNKKPYHFYSKMIQVKNNNVVELLPYNVGWNLLYFYENGKVYLNHKGYVFKFFKWFIPIPLGLFVGRINAVEEVVSQTTFKMQTEIKHPLFGKMYEYGGEFTLSK